MNETLKSLLENEAHNYCFSWETESSENGSKKTWKLTMTPDEDEENGKANAKVAETLGKGKSVDNAKPDKEKGMLFGSSIPDVKEAPDYKPKEGEEIVRIVLKNGDVSTATVLHDHFTKLSQTDRLNSMLVAFCREAASMMNLSFEDLMTDMADAMLNFVTKKTVDEFLDLLIKDIEGKKG